jgi:hypothetical protein
VTVAYTTTRGTTVLGHCCRTDSCARRLLVVASVAAQITESGWPDLAGCPTQVVRFVRASRSVTRVLARHSVRTDPASQV